MQSTLTQFGFKLSRVPAGLSCRASRIPEIFEGVRPQGAGASQGQGAQSQALVSDIPDVLDVSGESAGEPQSPVQGRSSRMPNSPGVAPEWGSPSSYVGLFQKSHRHQRQVFLRLRLWETRVLLDGEEQVRSLQLSSEGGHSDGFLWRGAGSWFESGKGADFLKAEEFFWRIERIEGLEVCKNVAIWLLPKRDHGDRPWILLVEQKEDRRIRIAVYSPSSERTTQAVAQGGDDLPRFMSANPEDRRVVELEYRREESFPTGAAFCEWTKTELQDDDSRVALFIFEDIRNSERGGLLRSLHEWRVRLGYDGRVQGSQADPMAQSVAPRVEDEPQAERQTDAQEPEHPYDHSEQLHPGGMLCQGAGKRPRQARHSQQQVVAGSPDGSPGHKRVRRSARLAGLRTDEEYQPTPFNNHI